MFGEKNNSGDLCHEQISGGDQKYSRQTHDIGQQSNSWDDPDVCWNSANNNKTRSDIKIHTHC